MEIIMSITSSDIARFLGKKLNGAYVSIDKPADLNECASSDITWIKKFSLDRVEILESRRPGLVICDQETSQNTSVSNIISQNPRLDFIRVMNRFFLPPPKIGIHQTAIIEEGATLGSKISVGAYCCIGSGVTIGDNCLIHSGVAIEGKVHLGRQCVIKANSVIGGEGFGFEYDEDGNPIHFPHIGRIEIGDNVWIGACTTVEIGALGATVICNGCKIDDLVQVGHNVVVGKNTLIMANTVICGGAIIGEKCWIAPNSVIKEKIRVGNRVTIGLGSVVIRNIEDDIIVAGVPAAALKPKNR
jgi:UDP-3-O-[3-hydroxymyristoyl] glucosamine N-acyltransferase